jgi:hypothetical protein
VLGSDPLKQAIDGIANPMPNLQEGGALAPVAPGLERPFGNLQQVASLVGREKESLGVIVHTLDTASHPRL